MLWLTISPHIPKNTRHTLGAQIENKFLDLLELTYTTYFTNKDKKTEKVADCIFALDILKFFIATAWEGKIISHRQYEEVSLKLDEAGKMLGGWRKSLNNPDKKNRDL